jgi:ribose transport system ATP-binding protein
MRDLDVRPSGRAELPFAKFSGGNQQKLVLARQLRDKPAVLLLDEPTQGVDVGAKQLIHERITASAQDGMAVVVSSSDNEELAAVCSRVLVLRGGRVADVLTGSDISVDLINRLSLAAPGRRGDTK